VHIDGYADLVVMPTCRWIAYWVRCSARNGRHNPTLGGRCVLLLILEKHEPTSKARTSVSTSHVDRPLARYMGESVSLLAVPRSCPSIQRLARYQPTETTRSSTRARDYADPPARIPLQDGQFATNVHIESA